MLDATRTWTLAGSAGLATLLLAVLVLAGAPVVLDVADAPLRSLGEGAVPLALAKLLGFLGNVEVLLPALLVLSLALLYRERAADAALVMGAFLVEEVLVGTLKTAVARARPEDAWIAASGWSFPSGHAARAALVACLLVYLNRHRIAAALAAAWAFLGAAARVVLGVHHVTDVTAGLGLGLAVGALGIAMTLAVKERAATVRVPVSEVPAEAPAVEMPTARPRRAQ
jgi:undecaprenyl-diphosphatase